MHESWKDWRIFQVERFSQVVFFLHNSSNEDEADETLSHEPGLPPDRAACLRKNDIDCT